MDKKAFQADLEKSLLLYKDCCDVKDVASCYDNTLSALPDSHAAGIMNKLQQDTGFLVHQLTKTSKNVNQLHINGYEHNGKKLQMIFIRRKIYARILALKHCAPTTTSQLKTMMVTKTSCVMLWTNLCMVPKVQQCPVICIQIQLIFHSENRQHQRQYW